MKDNEFVEIRYEGQAACIVRTAHVKELNDAFGDVPPSIFTHDPYLVGTPKYAESVKAHVITADEYSRLKRYLLATTLPELVMTQTGD